MSSFVFMKILESSPERYDRGIQIISRGRIGEVYETIAREVAHEGRNILDIGCGTGNTSIACATRGATLVGIDINSGMLEIARRKAAIANLNEKVRFLEIGVAEMNRNFKGETFDACVSCLAFSELTKDEQSYAISKAYSLLRPGGLLMIADEVYPTTAAKRFMHSLFRIPAKLLAYLLTQATTRPLDDVNSMLQEAGFTNIEIHRIWNESFAIIRAYKKGEK